MSKKVIIRRKATSHVKFSDDIPALLQRIYTNRGIQSEDELKRGLGELIPFSKLAGINAATQLLTDAVKQQQRILIVGDFDADGATSSALAMSALSTFGVKNVNYLVPNRFEYGYGLTKEIVDVAAKWQPDLIITVDNGISSIEGVDHANSLGIKVLVTDHHLPGKILPKAAAIVNPNQPGCDFPSKNLAGVGVIFYVMCALRTELNKQGWFDEIGVKTPNMGDFLDLAALGTVADVVPLDQNNRILVHQGLGRIRMGKGRPGIKALIQIAKRNEKSLTASDFGFAIGPRLNAAGRLDDMSLGIECLLATTFSKGLELAQILDDLNHERKAIELEMKQQAFKDLEKLNLSEKQKEMPLGLCIYDSNWHQGVIGILASRIKDKYHRPVIAFAKGDNQLLKGSARSVTGLHIRDALDAVATKHPDLISKFGGHAMAAGLSLDEQKLTAFSEAFAKEVENHLSHNDLCQEIYSDGELTAGQFNLNTAQMIESAGPWGQHFPMPTFDGEFAIINQRIVGANHLKLTLQVHEGPLVDAIYFNVDLNQWPNHRLSKVKAAYRLDINEYQGVKNLQLMIEHLEV